MSKFLDQINEQNLEIVCILIAIVAILLAIIVILDAISKRKKENQTEIKELINIEEQKEVLLPKEETIAIENSIIEEKLSKTKPIEEIKYVEENSEEEKTKAKIELQNLKQTLMKMEMSEQAKPKNNILSVANTNNVIEDSPVVKETNIEIPSIIVEQHKEEPKKVELSLFDMNEKKYIDEEKNAIISIEELKKASQNTYSDEEMYKYEDEGNEPISIQELEALQNTIKMKPIEELPTTIKKEEPKKNYYEKENTTFQTTPDISPIYGIRKTEESITLEQTANYDKLNEEIKKTTEFLATLKELRKNLE